MKRRTIIFVAWCFVAGMAIGQSGSAGVDESSEIDEMSGSSVDESSEIDEMSCSSVDESSESSDESSENNGEGSGSGSEDGSDSGSGGSSSDESSGSGSEGGSSNGEGSGSGSEGGSDSGSGGSSSNESGGSGSEGGSSNGEGSGSGSEGGSDSGSGGSSNGEGGGSGSEGGSSNGEGGGSGSEGGGSSDSSSETIGSTSETGYSQSSGTNSATGETYTSTNSDENAVQITGGSFTMTDCTVLKSAGDTSDSDNSSFYGTNAAVYCGGSSSVLNISGGSVTTSAAGANAIFAYDYGTINVSDLTINTSSNLSRGIHATGGGIINASNLNVTTAKTNCSVIATDRGGGTVTVTGGTYVTTGDDSAVTYSTGTITATDIVGSSSKGEMSVIEGDNSITLNSCDMTSGSSSRGMMILQSGSGDSEGYNGSITVNGGSLSMTSSSAPLLEVPTYITATLTLKDVTLSVPSNLLMYVNYNTQWTSYGGTGILNLTTDSTWTYTGEVYADSYSTAIVNVGTGVTWNGSINNDNAAQSASVTVEGIWNLTADSSVDELSIGDEAAVYTNGFTLSYNSLSGSDNIYTTGIKTISYTDSTPAPIFSINGMMIKSAAESLDDVPPGIYIFKGKKYSVH